MSFEAITFRLENLLDITSSKRIHAVDYVSSGIPFYRGKEVIEKAKGNSISTELFITNQKFDEIRQKFGSPKNGDILLTSVGTLGVPYFIHNDGDFYFKDGNLTWFKNFSNQIDSKYLYYWLISPSTQQRLDEISIGSTQKALTISALKSLEIYVPSLYIQKEIVTTLDSISNRIILLRKTNIILEAIAQALFKSWFVDFDPVYAKAEGREPEGIDAETAKLFPDGFEELTLDLVPKEWHVATLDAAYEINPVRKLRKGEVAPYLDMANVPTKGHHPNVVIKREMGSGSKFINGDTLLARITPCLENGKTAFVDFLNDAQVGWGSTEFVVLRPKAPLPPYHGYLLSRHIQFREFAIQSMSGTSGRQRIQIDVLGRYQVVIPTQNIAEMFGFIIAPIQQKITANSNQSKILSNLRDSLLPRLISGEMQLSKTDTLCM